VAALDGIGSGVGTDGTGGVAKGLEAYLGEPPAPVEYRT